MASTFNLQSTLNWALPFLNYEPANLGVNNEPSLSNANIVLQTILGPPFSWRWNRNVVTYNVTSGQQDFPSPVQFASSWISNHAFSVNDTIIDSNGNVQQCTTQGTSTNGTHPTWSTTVMGFTQDNTVGWKLVNPFDFGFIESASANLTGVNPSYQLEVDNFLGMVYLSGDPGRPQIIAPQFDNNNGVITFRTLPIADATYTMNVTYQKKANLFQSLASSWSPIPDEYSYIYNWGFLAMSTAFSDDPKFPIYNQKFVSALLGASEGLSELDKSIFLGHWMDITGQMMSKQIMTQAGQHARSV